MDEELKRQLEWMNENLNAVVKNQALIYAALEEIKDRLPQQESRAS